MGGRIAGIGVALALLAGLAGCNDRLVRGDHGDAVDYVAALFESHFADCDGIWTTDLGGGNFQQLRALALEIETLEIAEADRVNGLDYAGLVGKGDGALVREGFPGGWRPWQDGSDFPRPKIERRAGIWSHTDGGAPAFRGVPVDCGALPAG